MDTRIDATVVSGYFGPREKLWAEPIYRNVFGLLHEFGDAEMARLVVPRTLIVEYAPTPIVEGPPPATPDRAGAAPGRIYTPAFSDVAAVAARAGLLSGPYHASIQFLHGKDGATTGPLAAGTLEAFLHALSGPDLAWRRLGQGLPISERGLTRLSASTGRWLNCRISPKV